jgi:hypothetical protein
MQGYPCSPVHWPAVVRVGERSVSPLCPASGCAARRRLPSRRSLGPPFPPVAGPLRRDDCRLPVSGRCACRALPTTLSAALVRGLPSGLVAGRKRPGTPGPVVPRSPTPGLPHGDRRLAHVPAFPLCSHAPLADPGGVLRTRPHAPRTTAFPALETVGFPPRSPWRGSITRPVSSLPPASSGPWRGGTRVRS